MDGTVMYSTEQLQNVAQDTANSYAEIANRMLGCNLPIPVQIDFDLQNTHPKAAGQASHDMKIRINMILFEDNTDYILNETVPHEIGHLIQYDKFENKGIHIEGHGIQWQEIMKRIGKKPSKYHNLDTTKSVIHFKASKKLKKNSKLRNGNE